MTTLYYAPGACSFAAHVILRTLEASHGLKPAFISVKLRQEDPTIHQVNPLGRVPTLKLDNGELLTENGAILPYLGDLIPEAGLFAPTGTVERARIQEWIGFINSDIHYAFRPIGRPEFYNVNPETHDVIRSQGRAHLTKLLNHIEKRLSNLTWAVGERFTIADAYLGYFLRNLSRVNIPSEQYPSINAYVARYAALPAVIAATEAEKI
ncbi:MAG: glutathione S-transferase [Betaproteobacteria bacterium HGW-Betaproteobacteria-22]|nr:MAG: glutathione S-transferase [Betaproteobacteria bacterium HGW-Betaproteobacteria-22]